MIIEFKTIRQPPYYRTLYNNRKLIYSPKNYNYVGSCTEVHQLGGNSHHNCQRNCGIMQIVIFLIVFLYLIKICLLIIQKF